MNSRSSMNYTETPDIDSLPIVRKRVNALKKQHLLKMEVMARAEKEVIKLLAGDIGLKLEELRLKQKDIVTGKVEPSEEDCHHEFESEDESEPEELRESHPPADPPKGIPDFWLTAMYLCRTIRESISEMDEPVLKSLTDIAVKYSDVTDESFKLRFEFSFDTNDFFTNEVLTKEYDCKFGVNPKDPWMSFPTYYPVNRKGCKINWRKGQNVLKSSKDGPSIFRFFELPPKPKDDREAEDFEEFMSDDWELALYMARRFVPQAAIYYSQDLCEEEEESESSGSETESIGSSEES